MFSTIANALWVVSLKREYRLRGLLYERYELMGLLRGEFRHEVQEILNRDTILNLLSIAERWFWLQHVRSSPRSWG